jgi:FixJ family two-component response regulator
VLLASGHDDITLSSQAAGQLPHTLLRKPYSREQLATAIRAALEPAA